MTDIKIYLSETHDPWFNLATEDWIFSEMDPAFQVLFLWRNADTVVIGRFQNPWTECDVNKMEAEGVKLARRQSGGGAVYHDLGNTNFTFLSGIDEYSRERNNRIITGALNGYGITAYASGRNDILVDERKVSGSAFKLKKDRAFHHGTLLISADMDKLSRYLTPAKKKLMAKGIASTRSRVANLREFNPAIDHHGLCKEIINRFLNEYGRTCEVEILDHGTLRTIPHLMDYYEHLKDWNWRFGKTPEFTHHLTERLSWGSVELYLNVQDGVIRDYELFSDSLVPDMIQGINEYLMGVRYDREAVADALEGLTKKMPECDEDICEFSLWLTRNL